MAGIGKSGNVTPFPRRAVPVSESNRKVSKTSVDYRPATGAPCCGHCKQFHKCYFTCCMKVRGWVEEDHVCALFEAK